MTTQRAIWIVLLVAVAVAVIPAAHAKLEPVTSVEGITEYRLDNGLQVLLFPDPSRPTLTVNVTYFVGSRHEGRGEKGMAHLLEHMVFKGTPTHPDIWRSLEDHGARFNGTTWVDRTNYYETLPSEPGNLEYALTMEADRMVASHIRQSDLDTEFSVVRNEFEMGENDPVGVLWERILSAAYIWHNYGDSTIGSKSDIERVPIQNLKAFYRRYYQPDNAMLVVAGNFDEPEALALIESRFGAIPRPARKLDPTYTVEPPQDGARLVELRRNGDVAAAGTAYHIVAAAHPDFPATELIQQVLTDEPSGRLYKALVESGMASSVGGWAFGWREPGIMVNLAQVRAEDPVRPVLDKMNAVIEGLPAQPITGEELARAKRSLLKNIELAMKNSGRIGIELSEWAAAGDWRLLFLHRDRLEKLTLADVNRVASTYFKETNRTAGLFFPSKEIERVEVPLAPEVAEILKGYKGGEAIAEGEQFDATPENIESRVTRAELQNGLRLAMLAKQTRGDAVTAAMTLRFGAEADIKGHQAAIEMIPSMLMRGTTDLSYQQLQDRMDELKASINVVGGGGMRSDGVFRVRLTTDRQHLVEVLRLTHQILRHPAFPAGELEIVRKEQLALLEEQLSDPQALAFRHLYRTLNPYPADDVRYVPTTEEELARVEAVELAELREFHREVIGASHAQVAVVGDFDPHEVRAVIEETLGQWSSPRPYERVTYARPKELKGSNATIRTPDKQMAMVAVGTLLDVRDDDPTYAALHLSNYVLGSSAKSWLLERLRQKEGISYGAGSMLQADAIDRNALFGGMAIAAPQNAPQAADSLLDEFRRLVKDGIAADELADAKGSFALQVKTSLANDRNVARMLNEGLFLDRTMAYYGELYEAVARLTPEQVRDALKRHVDVASMTRVSAGDLTE